MDVGQDRSRLSPSGAAQPTLDVRWPTRAQALLETSLTLCIDHLHAPLRACLTQYAQQLFGQAERTHHYGDQQKLFTLRERILVDQSMLEQRFITQLTRSFDQVDAPAARAAEGAGPTWHQLELLDPVEQELATTLDQLGTRGDSRHGGVLYELGYRMAVLIGAPPLEGEALPLGLDAAVMNALERDLSRRTPTAAAFADAVQLGVVVTAAARPRSSSAPTTRCAPSSGSCRAASPRSPWSTWRCCRPATKCCCRTTCTCPAASWRATRWRAGASH